MRVYVIVSSYFSSDCHSPGEFLVRKFPFRLSLQAKIKSFSQTELAFFLNSRIGTMGYSTEFY